MTVAITLIYFSTKLRTVALKPVGQIFSNRDNILINMDHPMAQRLRPVVKMVQRYIHSSSCVQIRDY